MRDFLYPVAVAVSALTTLITPWLIRASGPAASWVDDHLPHPLQTYASLYGSWVQALRRDAGAPHAPGPRIRGLVGLLFIDLAAIAGIVIGASLGQAALVDLVTARLPDGGASSWCAGWWCWRRWRWPRRSCWARSGWPGRWGWRWPPRRCPAPASGGLDLAAAPRRALLVTFQLAILIVAGVPLIAVTQPFVPGIPGHGGADGGADPAGGPVLAERHQPARPRARRAPR